MSKITGRLYPLCLDIIWGRFSAFSYPPGLSQDKPIASVADTAEGYGEPGTQNALGWPFLNISHVVRARVRLGTADLGRYLGAYL